MNNIIIGKTDELVMKLLHYFIGEGYTPIILHGAQNEIWLENLEEKELSEILEIEKIRYAYFQNQKCDEIKIWDFQFEYCKFHTISMQKAKIEKVTFRDVLFENCNFSNSDFVECSFIRCEFKNCKISGCNFSENGLYHISFVETNANYINLAMAILEKLKWNNSQMRNSYFQETKIKNIYFCFLKITVF